MFLPPMTMFWIKWTHFPKLILNNQANLLNNKIWKLYTMRVLRVRKWETGYGSHQINRSLLKMKNFHSQTQLSIFPHNLKMIQKMERSCLICVDLCPTWETKRFTGQCDNSSQAANEVARKSVRLEQIGAQRFISCLNETFT